MLKGRMLFFGCVLGLGMAAGSVCRATSGGSYGSMFEADQACSIGVTTVGRSGAMATTITKTRMAT